MCGGPRWASAEAVPERVERRQVLFLVRLYSRQAALQLNSHNCGKDSVPRVLPLLLSDSYVTQKDQFGGASQ